MTDLRRALGLESVSPDENSVHYEVFPGPEALGDHYLSELRRECLQHVLLHTRSRVWQHDRFELRTSTECPPPWRRRRESELPGPSLWGHVNFADNVEDEWFVVYLLLEITRAFPDLLVRAWDNDGEFPLIEAAYHLPKRLTPDLAENRVWIRGGAFHLLPLDRPARGPVSIERGIEAMRTLESPQTLAAPGIASALAARIAKVAPEVPEVHVAHALLPARAARLFRRAPQLLPAAVEALYYRDVDDAKAVARPRFVTPDDLTPVALRFSRCLYAQSALQDFDGLAGYRLPLPSEPQYRTAALGSKIAAGLEMLLAKGQDGLGCPAMDVSSDTAFRDADPAAYLALTEALREPEQLARAVFAATHDEDATADPGDRPQLEPETALDWLAQGEARLEEELASRQAELETDEGSRDMRGRGPHGADAAWSGGSVAREDRDEDWDPAALAARMRAFLGASGGPEGAELPDEDSDDDGGEGPSSARGWSPGGLLRELRAALGGMDGEDASSLSEGSSFYGDDTSDEDEQQFSAAYDGALRDQLRDAELAVERERDLAGGGQVPGLGASEARAATQRSLHDDLRPVEIDMNLVENLLACVETQHGAAGPGSAMAALLGASLPKPRRRSHS